MSTAEKLMLPDRLFQPGTETNKLERINRFCGEKNLEDVKTALGNDFSKIKESFMGPFIEFIERKEVIFSRNIVHYLLQRRIMTVDNQLWFAFGEQPMRFGLREFALTTGLKCFEDQPENSSRKRSRENKDAWWMKKPKKLCELVAIMQAGEKVDDENLRLGALIICVVIFISSNPATNISIENLKRAKNFERFCGLPWGKISYQALKDSIMFLNPIKMSKSQYFLCGFNIALQFWAMSSVKQLGMRFGIKGPSRDLPLCFQWIGNVAPSYREVAEVADSDEVEVTCIVGDRNMLQNLEEVGDAEFEKVIKLVQSGYRIKRDDWVRRFIIVGSIETDKTIDDQYIIGVLKSKVKKLTKSNMILKKNVTYLKKKLWIKTREKKKVEDTTGEKKREQTRDGGDDTTEDTTEGKKRKQTNKDRDDNTENVSRTSTKKKMKHSGRPFSEDSNVEEVIVLSDCEGGTNAKEEERNRNKEREEGQGAEEPQHPQEEEPKRGKTDKESQHQQEKEPEQEETCKQDEAQKTQEEQQKHQQEENPQQEEAQQKQKDDPQQEEHHPEVEKDAYKQDVLSQDEMDKIDEKLKELSDDKELENPPVPDMPQHDLPFICYVRRRGRFKAITKDEEGEKKLDKEVNEKIEVEGKKEDKDGKLHTAKKRAKETTNDNMKYSKKRKTKNEQHSPDDPFKRTMDNVKCYLFELFYLTCGIDVSKEFFAQLAKPHQLLKGEDMEVLAAMLWERMSSSDTKKHISVIDHRFPSLLADEYFEFQSHYLQSSFVWHRFLPVFLLGNTVTENKVWGKDVDTVYCPMCWESNHWVGLVIYLKSSNIEILDPFIERTSEKGVAKHMDPITKMLPFLLKDICGYTDPSNLPLSAFTWKRLTVYQASKESDCGVVALKLIEMHICGRTIEDMAAITSKDITEARKKYVVDVYSTLISREDRKHTLQSLK